MSPDSFCQVHIQDQTNQDSSRVPCPDKFGSMHQHWKPSFDASTENIFWFNTQTKEILNMHNPLRD